ncbi:unnamed protein product [Microthlaspi erraticum]|uniref:Phorbol-ester/DAG-type domain-containing protein n=1 Tax=Microthlaspi erraticum TaxID=1685480 RepID=A0A6D2JY65_9BRAS|nr:unnamed protein product [Microthlaspi erraticum]
MAELKHGAHECVLTSPEIVADGICNICNKDEPVEFACDLCNFDLCSPCSKLPPKVSHNFHTDHPLELCVGKIDGETRHMLCSGCGNLFSEAFYYKCKECEIYLDLSCAVLTSIETAWDAEEKLHYSHAHLLTRCRPGTNARGRSCLLCELPLSPSAICYGCVLCNSFVHEGCLDLPREIQHPVHWEHPLIRLDFTHNCGTGKKCDACRLPIEGVPLGCPECGFNLHMRCADALLRSCLHDDYPDHKLFYRASGASKHRCVICKGGAVISLDSYYRCMACDFEYHYECLEIPESVVKKSYHVHPLFSKTFLSQDDSMEYCGVCETIVHEGHHVYSCKVCDFVGHIECITKEERPFPLYLKDLYSCGENVPRLAHQEECETEESEKKLVVNDISHNHVMENNHLLMGNGRLCGICHEQITGRFKECETCEFWAHDSCLEMRQPSRYRFHLNHPLTLMPSHPAGFVMNCDTCKETISSFNLFCRICNFIICTKCMVKAKKSLGELQRGQKFIRYDQEKCCRGKHNVVQVLVSRSYPVACTICNDKLYGNIVSCTECKEIYHSRCIDQIAMLRVTSHRVHSDHKMIMELVDPKSKCSACKLDIEKYGFSCEICVKSFHPNCLDAVGIRKMENHKHHLYNFWSDDDSSLTHPCTVCSRPRGSSFYGCDRCNFSAHAECIGYPSHVKNQRHRHTVRLIHCRRRTPDCSLCGSYCRDWQYFCIHCFEFFHLECTLSMDDREAATEEEQIQDIYLMHLERHLLDLLQEYIQLDGSMYTDDQFMERTEWKRK